MARAKKENKVAEEALVVETEKVVEMSAVTEAVKGEARKAEYPEIAGNGKFQAVAVGNGFVVYNPVGQRASGVLSDAEARDLVNKQNTAGHLK